MDVSPPEGLDKSLDLWNTITKTYELRVDELRILEDACREIEIIERLEAELTTAPLMVKGSHGGNIASPILQEVRMHRAIMAKLLQSLRLPDEESNANKDRSAAGRSLAMKRWAS